MAYARTMQSVVDSAGLSVGSIFLVSVVSVFPAIHCDLLQFTAFVIQRARTILVTKEGNSSRLISQQTFALIPYYNTAALRPAAGALQQRSGPRLRGSCGPVGLPVPCDDTTPGALLSPGVSTAAPR